MEARLTQHEDIVTIAVVSFRRELIETSETRNKTEYAEIADVIRLMLFDKKYRICKVEYDVIFEYYNIFFILMISGNQLS